MKYNRKILFSIIQLFLFLLNISSCSASGNNNNSFLLLDKWEVNIGKGWEKTLPVPWETPVQKGGIGASDYDGFGEYRTRFNLPDHLKNKTIAFYSECIDDADIAFLNGKQLGETGKVPHTDTCKNCPLKMNDFRSAVREARLYVIPNELLNINGENELIIKVFDFSGTGGFCSSLSPVIGPYETLLQKERMMRFFNDTPRTLFISILFCLIILFIINIIIINRHTAFTGILRVASGYFNIIRFIRHSPPDKYPNGDINAVIGARFLISIFILLMSLMFLLSEITYKYYFIESEIFWFKMPPVFCCLMFAGLIAIFHAEVFGSSISRNRNSLRMIFSIISHPAIVLLLALYFCTIPANKAWSQFMLSGLWYGFFITVILFILTGINLLKWSRNKIPDIFHKYFQYEGIARIILIIFMIFTQVMHLIRFGFGWQFFIMNIFLIIYMLLSLSFLSHNRIKLPLNTTGNKSLFTVLQTKYSLTYIESSIAFLISEGYSRNDICKKLNIATETIKKHLNSVYKKTIGTEPDHGSSGRDKFQRVTVFLNRIVNNK